MKFANRLTWFFLLAEAIILAAFSVALHVSAARYLARQADDRMVAALDTLTAAAEVGRDDVEWEPEERRLRFSSRAEPRSIAWVVADDRGRIVDASSPLAESLFPAEVLRDARADSRHRGIRKLHFLASGETWRVAARRIDPTGPRPSGRDPTADQPEETSTSTSPRSGRFPSLVVGVAVDQRGHADALDKLDLALVVISSSTWLGLLVVGGGLCRRALRPLSDLAGSARALDGSGADWHLPAVDSGDEIDHLARSFNALLGRLRVSFERQARFAGDASHQLRTPLTAIQGQVDLALRQPRDPDEYRRVLSLVGRRARHLGQIVEGLLFLARDDADALRPSFEPIDLEAWAALEVPRWSGSDRHRDLRFVRGESPASPRPPRVLAQPALLLELLDNLIDNAAKYGRPGTPIVVRSDHLPAEGMARLSVIDEGMGIEPDDADRVGAPFFRSEVARGVDARGVGLGLSVARRIAHLFGGSLRIGNRDDARGCVATLELPLIADLDAEGA